MYSEVDSEYCPDSRLPSPRSAPARQDSPVGQSEACCKKLPGSHAALNAHRFSYDMALLHECW